MSVFGSSGGSQTITLVGASAPVIVQVPMTLGSTEYSYALPSNCKQFLIRTEQGSDFDFGYLSGQLLLPVPRFCFYSESGLSTDTTTIYFQSQTPGETAIIVTWV